MPHCGGCVYTTGEVHLPKVPQLGSCYMLGKTKEAKKRKKQKEKEEEEEEEESEI